MNRYSKIKLVNNTNKSRSIDFSDLQSFPLETKHSIEPQEINFKPQEPKTQNTTTLHKPKESSPNDHETDENQNTSNGGRFGLVKLGRNRSVSAHNSTSNRFKIEKLSANPMQSAVKRVFSMRRSSSVSERYCRIHDQCVTVSSPLQDDDYMDTIYAKNKKKNKNKYSSGNILKACKRLLGI